MERLILTIKKVRGEEDNTAQLHVQLNTETSSLRPKQLEGIDLENTMRNTQKDSGIVQQRVLLKSEKLIFAWM
ncbi:MAG: hypothetical protein AXW16_02785 [Cycloclasticus sp. Phe_18]|nr:MAG: hypothetical protein AXW16_02785 [Cycloclasticus sp. Phe_18]